MILITNKTYSACQSSKSAKPNRTISSLKSELSLNIKVTWGPWALTITLNVHL